MKKFAVFYMNFFDNEPQVEFHEALNAEGAAKMHSKMQTFDHLDEMDYDDKYGITSVDDVVCVAVEIPQ